MDFFTTAPKPRTALWRLVALGAAALALGIYAAVLALNVAAVAGGSDSSGYMNDARLMAAGKVHVQPRSIEGLPPSSMPPFLYVPLGFKPSWNGDGMVPTYPTGFALLVLAMKALAGWRHAADLVLILHALAGIIAMLATAHWVTGAHRVVGPIEGPVTKSAGAPTGEVAQLGKQLFTTYLFAFEATAALLVIAVVGAVVLARRPATPEDAAKGEADAVQEDRGVSR